MVTFSKETREVAALPG